MDKLFLTILNMSLTGAFVIAAICLARLPLKKAPKIISYCLWAVAGFRLVLPFSIESMFSLIPFKAQPIPLDIAMQAVPHIDSGIEVIDSAISTSLPAASTIASINPLQIWQFIGSCIWLFGVAVLLVYGIVSFIILKQKMGKSTHIEENIYEAENIQSPFVLGVLTPRIYLPIGLSAQEKYYIILHEKTHIRRRDHIIKLAAYFILCLHWFNPLAWVAFLLMGVDMEMSCDERVLKEIGSQAKKDYSLSLLSLATERRIIVGSPLAFSEGGLKARIKNVLDFKKPSRTIIVAAVALVAVLSIGFAGNREGGRLPFKDLNADEISSISLFCRPPEVTVVIDDRITIQQIANTLQTVVTYEKDDSGREYAGQLVQYTLTMLSGETIEVGAFGSFIFINSQCYRTMYEPSEELNRLGNQLRGDKNDDTWTVLTDVDEPESKEPISPSVDVSEKVEDALRIIMSSPLHSSNPQDYINEHWQEYENITAKYPEGVLEYLLSQFEAGNSDGLRGHIMMRMCKEMLGLQNNVTDEALSPQEWYKQLSIISEIILPDFKPESPVGKYGEIVYSAITQYYSSPYDGFLVSAPTIYGEYEEEGKLKIIMNVFYMRYKLYGKTLESKGGGVIPGAAIFRQDERSGEWIFEEYLEVGSRDLPDGAYIYDSIQKLCTMPVSGKEITGLAENISSDNSNIRQEELMQNLKEHLSAHGQIGISLRKADGILIQLT